MDGGGRLRVALLGAVQVSVDGSTRPVPGVRLQRLLVRLALAGGRAVEPGVLVDAVWGEAPPAGSARPWPTSSAPTRAPPCGNATCACCGPTAPPRPRPVRRAPNPSGPGRVPCPRR